MSNNLKSILDKEKSINHLNQELENSKLNFEQKIIKENGIAILYQGFLEKGQEKIERDALKLNEIYKRYESQFRLEYTGGEILDLIKEFGFNIFNIKAQTKEHVKIAYFKLKE